MNNKELEDRIVEAILSGQGQLTPASELGLDNSDFTIDASSWADTMYDEYKDSCHLDNSLDSSQTFEKYLTPTSLDPYTLSCFGRIGYFRWYSLSVFFDENLHKMNENLKEYNIQHNSSAVDMSIEGPGEHLSQAINNNDELVNILKDPIVANMSDTCEDFDFELGYLEKHLRKFFCIDIIPEHEVFSYHDNGKISINSDTVHCKDVIIPGIYASTATLEKFGKYAQLLIEKGANTVIGIFVTRIVPSLDGKEGKIPEDQRVGSFAPKFGIDLSKLIQ